jgi:beta-glucanase (GH16 family)
VAFDPGSHKIGRRSLLAGSGAIALSALVSAPASATEVPANPLQKSGWTLDRHDEFNGSLDSGLWIPRYLESRTTAARATARYGFRNNALILRIDDDQPTYYANNAMKVSSLQTGQMTGLHKGDVHDHDIATKWNYATKYGYFEIRGKTCERSGLHCAFWMVGTQDSSTHNAEIDILEDPGPNSSQFLYNLHKWSDPNVSESSNTITTGFNLTNEMHIYALEWTSSAIKLYIDNKLVKTINSSPNYNMVFLLSLYENAGWTGTVDPSDTHAKEFVIDYFRAYKPA